MTKKAVGTGTTLVIPVTKEIPKEFPLGKNFTKDSYTDRKVYDVLIDCRAMLLKHYPFWGTWVVNLVFVEDPTNLISTCCTDGKHIFYSPKFLRYIIENSKTGNFRQEITFIIVHEIYHVLARHVAKTGWYRGKGFDVEGDPIDHGMYNAAADYFINLDISEANIGQFPTTVGGLLSKRFKGMTAEEIYLWLKHNPDEEESKGGNSGFDTHVLIVPCGPGEEPGLSRDEDGNLILRVPQEEFDDLSEKAARVTHQGNTVQHQHDQMVEKSAGSMPAGVLRIIDDLLRPKVNWRAALRRFVRTVKMRGYSMMNPNRSFFQHGITIPGFRKTREEIDMVVMIDASGSIGHAELLAFSSEIKGILDSMPSFKVLAWTFDGKVQDESVTKMEKRGVNTLETLKPFLKNMRGGGGTSFADNWRWMKENRIKPRVAVMFTDGMSFDGFGDPTYCPMLWLMTTDIKAPYGTNIRYEVEQH